LREQFGATQVIWFGSLVGQSPWHWGSDLDIAVAGLSNRTWLKAYGCLESLVAALEKVTSDLEVALEQSKSVPEDFAIRTLASYINDFYRRCERMSERVAVTLDGGLPQGVNWHQALLKQVGDGGGENRPPLWSGSLLFDLDEYRKFRHVLHLQQSNMRDEG
jgi:predicted nucleotidyltransferase